MGLVLLKNASVDPRVWEWDQTWGWLRPGQHQPHLSATASWWFEGFSPRNNFRLTVYFCLADLEVIPTTGKDSKTSGNTSLPLTIEIPQISIRDKFLVDFFHHFSLPSIFYCCCSFSLAAHTSWRVKEQQE